VADTAVVGIAVAPGDAATDCAALLDAGGAIGAAEREVAQAGELGLGCGLSRLALNGT